MEKILYYPVLDIKRAKAIELQKQIEAWLYQNITFDKDQANAILVWWWDGFMLDTMKKYFDEGKMFFGVNCGTLGFLLNQIDHSLPQTFDQIDGIETHPIQVEVITQEEKHHLLYALNDVVVWGNILDYFSFDIHGESFDKNVVWTGLILSTSLGSSGYRLWNGWPILPMQSNLRGIMGIAAKPFNYHLLKPQSIKITPRWRTSIMAGIDGYGGKIDDVKEINISPSDKKVSLWFLASNDFDSKRIDLSNQKLGWL